MSATVIQDKATYIAEIELQRARLRRLLRSKDAELLARRPSNGDWSIIEHVRHLMFAEQLHLGQFLRDGFEWSGLGLVDRVGKFADVGKMPTTDVGEVLAAWDVIHKDIRKAIRTAEDDELPKALWRNSRHLRIHIDVIERLLRRWGT